ncbi:MAG: hypothetical protein OHK0015_02950 [Chloroflexi bacterium OHK40]
MVQQATLAHTSGAGHCIEGEASQAVLEHHRARGVEEPRAHLFGIASGSHGEAPIGKYRPDGWYKHTVQTVFCQGQGE